MFVEADVRVLLLWEHIAKKCAFLLCTQGSDIEDEDMEELLNDTRLLKKFKKGKITEEEFEKGLFSSGKGTVTTADLGIPDLEEDC